MADVGGFSGEDWRPAADVRSFADLLSRIVIGDSAEECGCSRAIPQWVLDIIQRRRSLDPNAKLSFIDLFETLKGNDFRILEGVDSKEVSDFVRWIEFSEALIE
jgi:hypothetical protein